MSKNTIVIDGESVAVTFNSIAIDDINTVAFSIRGEREEINLTTIDATKFMVGLLADLHKIEDITINKKVDPAADNAHTVDNKQLAITYKTGKANTKIITFFAQLKSNSSATHERAPSDGINTDLVFFVTNLTEALVEQGPVITS